jgi:hypothetical protein
MMQGFSNTLRRGSAPVLICSFAIACGGFAAEPIFVTVGGGGHRMSSTDGVTWTNQQQWGKAGHDKNDLWTVVYGNGVFVAAGGFGATRIVWTKDGKQWHEVEAEKLERFRGSTMALLFNGERFVAMTQFGTFADSADGQTWTIRSHVPLINQPQQRIREMAYGNGIYIATGDYGTVAISDDGVDWKLIETAPGHAEVRQWPSIAYGNGIFVMTGENGYIATSKNGIRWENERTDKQYLRINGCSWTGREFIAIGRTTKHRLEWFRSTDGVTWETSIQKWKNEPTRVWLIGGKYYGVFNDALKGNTLLFTSADGKAWTEVANEKGYSVRWIASSLGSDH